MIKYILVLLFAVSTGAASQNFIETGTSPYCSDNEEIFWEFKKWHDKSKHGDNIGGKISGWGFENTGKPDNEGYSYYREGTSQPMAETHYTYDMTVRDDMLNSRKLTGYQKVDGAWAMGTSASTRWESANQMFVQCDAGMLAFGSVINLNDTPKQAITYGNPEMSMVYRYHFNHEWPTPFESGQGAIDFKVESHLPYYRGHQGNLGGHVTMTFFVSTRTNPAEFINFTNVMYSMNPRQSISTERIRGTDPNNNAIHVTSHIGPDTIYTTQMPFSESSMHGRNKKHATAKSPVFNHFFNYQFTYDNFQTLLNDLCNKWGRYCKGTYATPDGWVFRQSSIHYELNDNRGTAVMAGAHRGFKVTFK